MSKFHNNTAVFQRRLAENCFAEMPTYSELIRKALVSTYHLCFHPEKYSYSFNVYLEAVASINFRVIMTPLILAALISLCRQQLTTLFISSPLGDLFPTPALKQKAITPLWNFFAYFFLFCADSYVVLNFGYADFEHTLCIFKTSIYEVGYFESPVPFAYYWLYMLQLGYYLHSFYAVVHLDVKRRDHLVIRMHHMVTIMLLFSTLITRMYKLGAIVLFLHDLSDIFLELGKFFIAVRNRRPRLYAVYAFLANCLFALFTISWFVMRLYLYPLKVLHACTWGVYITHQDSNPHFFIPLNILMWVLFVLHVYWSYFIVLMLMKILLGRMQGLEDARDFETDSNCCKHFSSTRNANACNGFRYANLQQRIGKAI